MFLQVIAELRIKRAQAFRLSHAVPVGRVRDKQAGFGRGGELQDIALLKGLFSNKMAQKVKKTQ